MRDVTGQEHIGVGPRPPRPGEELTDEEIVRRLMGMPGDTINEKKNDRFAKDVTALLFILLGLALLTAGMVLVLGWGGICILYGLIFGVLGVSLGLSRTGKG